MTDHSFQSLVRHSLTAAATMLGAAGLAALVGEYGHRQITHAYRNDFRDDPARWGMGAAEEVDLTARDGVRIHSWLFRSPTAQASVIVLHGHGGNKHTCLPLAGMLYPAYNVLLLDHRGHGDSDGARTTIGFEERLDVHGAVDLLEQRGLGPVGVFGMSMGGAIAILAAAEDERIAVVVADSPFARLRWAVKQSAVLRGYPAILAPAIAYLGCLTTSLHVRERMQAFDPVEAIGRIAPRPVFLIHGVEDEIIPVESAHVLYGRAGEPKELWLIDGLLHCKAIEEMYEPFGERVRGFFDRWLGPAASATRSGASATGMPS